MQELINMTIDHYQIQRLLTRGGMAEIYLAEDVETHQTVAIKLVHESSVDYYARFQYEVREMSMLNHPHILPVLGYGEYGLWHYLVMPYVRYGTLHDLLAMGALTIEDAGCVLEQLTDALQYAHDQGVIHRDIKPSNILVRDGQHIYLADFGLVKRIGDNAGMTLTGYMIGTPEYLAPELAEEEATPVSDIYALGIVLYQMLTRHLPFQGSTPLAVYMKHIQELPIPPSMYNPALPPAIEAVVLRALHKDPRERFQTAAEMYQAYQRALALAEEERLSLAEIRTQTSMIMPVPAEIRVMKMHTQPRLYRPAVALLIATLLLAIPLLLGFSFSHPADGIKYSTNQVIRTVVVTPTQPPTPTATSAPAQQNIVTRCTQCGPTSTHNIDENTDDSHDNRHNHGHKK